MRAADHFGHVCGALVYGAAFIWAASNGQTLMALGLAVVALLTLAIVGLATLLAPAPPDAHDLSLGRH